MVELKTCKWRRWCSGRCAIVSKREAIHVMLRKFEESRVHCHFGGWLLDCFTVVRNSHQLTVLLEGAYNSEGSFVDGASG